MSFNVSKEILIIAVLYRQPKRSSGSDQLINQRYISEIWGAGNSWTVDRSIKPLSLAI